MHVKMKTVENMIVVYDGKEYLVSDTMFNIAQDGQIGSMFLGELITENLVEKKVS